MPVYLDHNATTPLRPDALEAMLPYFGDCFGNASSIHAAGREARLAVESSRRTLLGFLGVSSGELVFTASGTEAVFLGVVGAARGLSSRGRHVAVSSIEHRSAEDAVRLLEGEGWAVSRIAPDAEGRIDPRRVEDALRPDTVLVSVHHANNETGVVQPVSEIGALVRSRGARMHVDAVQSAGKLALDPEAWNADYVSIAAHKLGGPKGAGALWQSPGSPLLPIIPGTPERGLRGGTQDVPALVGFATAARLAGLELETSATRVTALRNVLESAVRRDIPSASVTATGTERLSNTTHLTFDPGIGADLVMALDLQGYMVSAGSACRSGSEEPSPVLLAMGMSPDRARTAVRVSLGRETTEGDVTGFVTALRAIVLARLAFLEH